VSAIVLLLSIAVAIVVVLSVALFKARAKREERLVKRVSSPIGVCYACKKPIAAMIAHQSGFGECLACQIRLCFPCHMEHRKAARDYKKEKLCPKCSAPHFWFFRKTLYANTRREAFVREDA
jgi:hypothetical protein